MKKKRKKEKKKKEKRKRKKEKRKNNSLLFFIQVKKIKYQGARQTGQFISILYIIKN